MGELEEGKMEVNGDGKRLDLGWWTHNTVHRWCIVKLYAWNLYDVINQCHSNKFNKKVTSLILSICPDCKYIAYFLLFSLRLLSTTCCQSCPPQNGSCVAGCLRVLLPEELASFPMCPNSMEPGLSLGWFPIISVPLRPWFICFTLGCWINSSNTCIHLSLSI